MTARSSVIIPTHSRPHLLPRAVESARRAGSNVEIIVVDDASQDRTAEVCKNLKDIKYIRLERNQGVAGARNVGLMESEGDYITFLDDDDLRLPGSIHLQAQALDAFRHAGFVCGGIIITDQDYRPTGVTTHPNHPSGDVFWNILEFDFPVMGLSTLIRKECFLRVGTFRRALAGIDDWDMFARLAAVYPAVVIPQPVGLHRLSTPKSGQGSSQHASLLSRIVCHQMKLFDLPRAKAAPSKTCRLIRKRTRNRIADHLLWSAARQLSQSNFRELWTSISVSLRISPLRIFQPRVYRKLGDAAVRAAQGVSPRELFASD